MNKLELSTLSTNRLVRPLLRGAAGAATAALLGAGRSTAAGPPRGQLVIPPSSIAKPEDAGVRVHTNVEYLIPAGGIRRAV
jgi:hypothetical protein